MYAGIEEGEECNDHLDIATPIPCEAGLVCHRESLERSVCRDETCKLCCLQQLHAKDVTA
jgi:hypothetical protein